MGMHHRDFTKLAIFVPKNFPVPAFLNEVSELLKPHSDIQLATAPDLTVLCTLIKEQNQLIVLLATDLTSDPKGTLGFLTLNASEIKSGILSILALTPLLPEWQDRIEAFTSKASLFSRIQEILLGRLPIREELLKELKIADQELVQAPLRLHDYNFLDLRDDPWETSERAFKSFELLVRVTTREINAVGDWLQVLLIENGEKEMLISSPKNSIRIKDTLRVQFHTEDTLGISDFEITGTVTSIESFEGETEQIISFMPISGDVEKLKALATIYLKRQDEILDFLKAAKGF